MGGSLRTQIQKSFSRIVTRYALLTTSTLLLITSAFVLYTTQRNLVAQSDLVRAQLKAGISATLTQADTLVHSPILWTGLMDSFSHETVLKPLFRQLNRMDGINFVLLDYQGRVSIGAPDVDSQTVSRVRVAIPDLSPQRLSVQLLRTEKADDRLLLLMPVMSPLSDDAIGYLLTEFSVTTAVQAVGADRPLEFAFNLAPDFPMRPWWMLQKQFQDTIDLAGLSFSYDTRYAISLLPDLSALGGLLVLIVLLALFFVSKTQLWLRGFATHLTQQLDQLVIFARDIFAGRPMAFPADTKRSDEIETVVRTLESLLADQALAQNQLRKMAYEDALTGLPIYAQFLQHLEQRLNEPAAHGRLSMLIVLDINKLKHLNDIHGYDTGDRILQETAAMLAAALPETRLLSRRSGDEFVAWAELDEHQLQELTAAVSRFEVRDHATRIPVSLTMGVARYPHDAANLNDLIFCAEYAHREAKRRARQSFVVFDHQLGARLARSRQIEERISRALQRCDIKPFYQPEVHMVTGQITGFEALARWHDPELGWIAPDEFVPVIEHLRLSSDLTQCILTGILYDAGQIRQRFPGCKIAFNAAPNDFHGNQLLDTIESYAARQPHGLAGLELELTEQDIVDLDVDMVAQLNRLIDAGIRVAIDDFGTRYSSLSRLTTLPLHRLKIDAAFVANIAHEKGEEIVHLIISLARTLELDITAEGVETFYQRDRLIELGCLHAQGWLYHKALPLAELLQLAPTLAPRIPVP
ncbi:MAG: putative bifunctional diguanylate cyclase/phosphodiesterase [Fluviibacter sp.]